MLYFTRILQTEEQGFVQFSFDFIVSSGRKKCHVSVLTRGPQQYHFVMEEKNERWRITEAPLPPEWIVALEGQIAEWIGEHAGRVEGEKQSGRLRSLPGEPDNEGREDNVF